MTAPLVDDLTDVDAEFAKPCANTDCYRTAEWLTWGVHNWECRPGDCFVCNTCKEYIEQIWIQTLGSRCECGSLYTGQLSANFRAIRL